MLPIASTKPSCAFFVEGLSVTEVAERFGYTPASFRVLAHHFRADPQLSIATKT